ncbi:MAG: hypothetical protein RMX65_019230 [Nostoc sp. DedQUE01]|nr:hypothetical protein [Nostoc sp. DedQUE11]MDZ8076016.1 hypothetical protein [Nostoc sp. DedQUE01]
MENRLQIQDIPDEQLDMELTPEELEELEALKGGNLAINFPLINSQIQWNIPKIFPYGTPVWDLFQQPGLFRS